MVAATARRRGEGLVPFDPLCHLGPVANLVAGVFGGELGPGARYVLRRMRQVARWGSLGLLLWGADVLRVPGFVWVEGGQVVGNISLRRAASPGGWMIGNVAVHPDWRGRGIGRALVEAAVRQASEQGGIWVGLEVREDNSVARRLYDRMGFEPVGTMLEMARPAGKWRPPAPAPALPLRRARLDDSPALHRLAQEGLSRPHREVLEVRPALYRAGWEARLGAWLEGCQQGWWVMEQEGRVVGAVGVRSRWPARYHWVEVLVGVEWLEDLGPRLVGAALTRLARRCPWEATALLPGPRESLEPPFAAAGFRRVRRLVQMRLILGRKVKVAGRVGQGGV